MTRCICDWPKTCGGERWVYCLGCGGDFCVCASCNGSGMSSGEECYGCADCELSDEDDEEGEG